MSFVCVFKRYRRRRALLLDSLVKFSRCSPHHPTKSWASPPPPGTQKRRADGEEEENRVLKANRFAALASDNVEKKERLPPFYTKGFPEHLYKDIDYYVKRGLQATLRRCTGGYKITVPSANHYKAVEELLKRESVEYFTHDKEAEKPLKVILRGLDDMDVKLLEEELKEAGLKPLIYLTGITSACLAGSYQ
nr:uncharacterized protein LOC115260969 [Aedes albopictus]